LQENTGGRKHTKYRKVNKLNEDEVGDLRI
jgi:hypothetical protein